MKRAEACGLDLVEVNPGDTPVCRILDYGKLKYQASKKEKKKEKKTHEIKFRPKIAEHDLGIKVKNARKFLEDGSTVKFTIKFKGRENAHPEQGSIILEKVSDYLKDIPTVSSGIQKQAKIMSMVLSPKEA